MAKPSKADAQAALAKQAAKAGAAIGSGVAAKATAEAEKLELMKRIIDNGPAR